MMIRLGIWGDVDGGREAQRAERNAVIKRERESTKGRTTTMEKDGLLLSLVSWFLSG